MTANYILDISKEEYRDDYADGENGELWQIYAKQQLISDLESILSDAKKYKQFRRSNANPNHKKTWLSHNAILVSSPRGTGKTVFLRNSKSMWEAGSTKKDELYFLDVIDPTMLMANDSFSNVIVAQIYQVVSDKLSQNNCCDEGNRKLRETFHKSLKQLAESMGKNVEFNGLTGIDKVLKYSSGIQLENNFHLFVESAIAILGCNAIVVTIDDVDMALDRAFEVVDDVRRFLGCPYLIPIVSGDIKLYEHMTQTHFDEKAYDNSTKDEQLKDNGQELSKELTTAYLTKVFPASMRIGLFSIERILPKLNIFDGEEQVTYKNYREELLNRFYFLCHNRDARRYWSDPESARELSQLVRVIKPKVLRENNNDIKEIGLHNSFKNWAALKKSGELFAYSESAIAWLHEGETNENFDIRKLLAFNIKRQTDKVAFPWSKYDVLAAQIEALDSLPEQGGKGYKNLELLNSSFKKDLTCLKAMPPMEFLVNDFWITIPTIKNSKQIKINNIEDNELLLEAKKLGENWQGENIFQHTAEQLLLDVYTDSSLYSTLNNSFNFLFFSRAFELIFYSLKREENLGSLLLNIYQILRRKPFYSVVSMADTKIAFDGEEEELSFSEDSTLISSTLVLSAKIREWREVHKGLFKEVNAIKLIPIFSYCFNSVLTAMNVIKGNYSRAKNKKDTSEAFRDEYLTDMVIRFKYNFLNSILRAGIFGEAVYANVLIGAKSSTVRDEGNLKSFERTYQRNLKLVEEELSGFEGSKNKKTQLLHVIQLHNAISEHPIFNFLDTESIQKLLKIGNKDSDSVTDSSDKKTSKNFNFKSLSSNLDILEQCEFELNHLIGDAYQNIAIIISNFINGRITREETIRTKLQELRDSEDGRLPVGEVLLPIQQAINEFDGNLFMSEDFLSIDDIRLKNTLLAVSKMELNND
ncbi:hypothetical protein AMS58_01330 [Pseudoalteromonas porphyrae]|uniref:hypothetical protein n=1 Tax=Pseudoalteromonas porphyrae TaxID=187330 RepID=UPI0006BB35B9|nr:hypothetical protein [Pseudoalteromonas porphyrae]KPH96236.1 hypothetical protein AMS58_01330 [Pseudoalteromonas porphyrae]